MANESSSPPSGSPPSAPAPSPPGIPLQMVDILGPAGGPPSDAPPGLPNGGSGDSAGDAAAAAAGAAAAAAVAGVRPLRQQDIARDIGQQVESMILQAKHASESRVSKEIQKIKQRMEQMGGKIKMITEGVNSLDPSHASGLLKADLARSIAKLEEVWDGEVGTLKHELWQTIQAHNHNSDLLKHHKDAIDAIQGRMAEQTSNPELEHIHRQLMQVDTIMQREQAKQQQLDQLMQRLTAVQQQLMHGASVPPPAAMGMGPWGAGLLPPGPMPGGPGAGSPGGPQAQAVGKKASAPRKTPKQAKGQGQGQGGGPAGRGQGGPGGGAVQPPSNLRPDAHEFVGFRAAAAEFVPMGAGGDSA